MQFIFTKSLRFVLSFPLIPLIVCSISLPKCRSPILPAELKHLVYTNNLTVGVCVTVIVKACESRERPESIFMMDCLDATIMGDKMRFKKSYRSCNRIPIRDGCLMKVTYSDNYGGLSEGRDRPQIEIWTNGSDISLMFWKCDGINRSLSPLLLEVVPSMLTFEEVGSDFSPRNGTGMDIYRAKYPIYFYIVALMAMLLIFVVLLKEGAMRKENQMKVKRIMVRAMEE